MAKKTKEPPRPFYPAKHQYEASLEVFLQASGRLRDAVSMLLELNERLPEPILRRLVDALAAYDKAAHHDDY